MNIRIGHRYQISLPNGKLVAGICDKIDHELVILRTMIKSWVFLRDDLENSKIEEIKRRSKDTRVLISFRLMRKYLRGRKMTIHRKLINTSSVISNMP
jgi:hypothetical protein